ncbi:MAG: IclR family transcriptional regulator [Bacteroidota bacterium]
MGPGGGDLSLNSKMTGKQRAATLDTKAHARDAAARTWNSTGKPVGAVISALAVLRAIHAAPHPLNASQVARAAGLYRGTAYNILQTLCSEGVVSYEPATKSYNISTQIFEMAHAVLRKSGLLDFVRPELFSLAEECGVTVFLAKVTDNFDLMVLDFVGSGFRIDSYFSVGRRSPRFSGAPGVLMAAFADVDLKYVKSQYELTEWFRRPTFEEFVERMQAAKRDGYSVDYGDRRSGLTQVAVPIFSGTTGKMALTITCIDFKRAFTPKRVQATAEAALACADRISSQMSKLKLD